MPVRRFRCTVYKAVSASCATGQPTQRTLRANTVRHPDARLFEAMARRPDARQALSLRYSSPSAPAALPVSPRNAHGVRALPVIPTTAEAIARRPNARQSLFVYYLSPSEPAARPATPRSAPGSARQVGHPARSTAAPGARTPNRHFLDMGCAEGKRTHGQAAVTRPSPEHLIDCCV